MVQNRSPITRSGRRLPLPAECAVQPPVATEGRKVNLTDGRAAWMVEGDRPSNEQAREGTGPGRTASLMWDMGLGPLASERYGGPRH